MSAALSGILASCRTIVERHHQQTERGLIEAIDAEIARLATPSESTAPPVLPAAQPEPPQAYVGPGDASWHHTEDDLAIVLMIAGRRRAEIIHWVEKSGVTAWYSAQAYGQDGAKLPIDIERTRDAAIAAAERALGLPCIPISPVDLAGDGGIPA